MIGTSDQDVVALLPDLMRYARMLTREESAAEDLVNSALLRAHERAATFDRSGSLRRWLFAILHNIFISDRRHDSAARRRDDALAEAAPTQTAATQESAAYLGQIMRRFEVLPENQRETMHLIVVEGLNYREAAEVLGVPVGTVMSRLSRARQTLRGSEGSAKAPVGLKIVRGKDNE